MKYTAELSQFLYYCASDLSPDPLLIKLEELARLPDGWRFGEGIPPQPTVIHTAREIYQRLADFRLQADVFPGVDGSLSLVFYAEERCVEIHVSQDKGINISVEDGEGFDFREIKEISNVSITEAVEEVLLLARELEGTWNLLDSFIHENTINMQNASAVHASPTPATDGNIAG